MSIAINLSQLTLDSTLANLPLHDFQVSASTLGKVVYETFEQQPTLPGVIVTQESRLVGAISRRKFLEKMSQPYSRELFLQRPIHILSEQLHIPLTQLPHNNKIDEAAQLALQRPQETLYEPILVDFDGTIVQLLDMPTLLLAQSQMLSLANEVVEQQKLAAQKYSQQLEAEQVKVKQYTKLLEAKQAEIQEHNQLLEIQKTELLEQSQQITQLNQKFVQLSQLLSVEGHKAFEATFEDINSIFTHAEEAVDLGRAFDKEFETLLNISNLIASVSRQVQYLSVQASIVINRDSAQTGGQSGFGIITTEISKLIGQTSEVGNQVNQIVDRFRLRIQQLTKSAQAGSTTARSSIEKVKNVQNILAQLEELVEGATISISQMADSHTSNKNLSPETELLARHQEIQRLKERRN